MSLGIPLWSFMVAMIQGHSGLGYVCCAVVSGTAKTVRVIFLSSFFRSFPLLEIQCLKFRGGIPFFFLYFWLEMFISVFT